MGKKPKKEKDNDPTTWGPEKETDFTFNAWERHRKERALKRDMLCFSSSLQDPTQSCTPTGWELEELQRLVKIVSQSPTITDPGVPHSLAYGGFDIKDPFDHEPPRGLEDEPLFPLEEIQPVKNKYQVVYGYMRHTDENYKHTWHKDEDNALEKFLCYLAEMYLPDDMMVRRWAVDFAYDWNTPGPNDTFWNFLKSIFSFKKKSPEEVKHYGLS